MKIRVDVCVTLDVPDGSRPITDSGAILLPGGGKLWVEPALDLVAPSGAQASLTKDDDEFWFDDEGFVSHIYYKTPVEIVEDYTGDDL